MRIQHPPLWIQFFAHGLETIKGRVQFPQFPAPQIVNLAPVGPAGVAAQDGLYHVEKRLVILLEILVYRQAGTGLLMEHGQQIVVGRDVTEFNGKEHVDVMLANGGADFFQAGDALFLSLIHI
mgnify:FL=1